MSGITPGLIRSIFDIDMEGGRMFWRAPPHTHQRLLGLEAGTPRGSHSQKIYWVIRIGGKAYKRGRLIFFAAFDRWPVPCIDHIDGNSLHDGILNLREATATENAWNHKRRKRRIALPMGVRLTGSGRYQARIGYHGTQIHLGAFDTPEEARAIYLDKRKELYGDFA